jgi:hypothetical protein
MRRKPRPVMRSLTHSAITSASPMDSGMVASANHRLLVAAFQNTGSPAMTS